MLSLKTDLRWGFSVPSFGLATLLVCVLSEVLSRIRLRCLRKCLEPPQKHAGKERKSKREKLQQADKEAVLEGQVPPPPTAVPPAKKSAGPKLNYLDRFLKLEVGIVLLEMGLFPNAKEITESMGCLQAVDTQLKIKFSDPSILSLVVGDGATPRTAALMAVRTKWHWIISVDPALHGLPCFESAGTDKTLSSMPREQRHDNYVATHVAGRDRMRDRLARISEIERLELRASKIEDVVLDVDATRVKKIVILLPHAHVVTDIVLGALRFEEDAVSSGVMPTISVVQLPCCRFVKHGQVCGAAPDLQYDDESMLTDASTVRVWNDVTAKAVDMHAVRIGDQPTQTRWRLAQSVRSDAAREEMLRNAVTRKQGRRNRRPQ